MERNNHQPTHDAHQGPETEPAVHPKIYAACLAAYNNGYLHGDWIYADQEPEYLEAEIQDMLEKSPVQPAEEWAIHDYDGFGGFDLHEYENLETVARVAGGIALHGLAFSYWIQEVGSDAEDAIETFQDHYRGTWYNMAEYAEHLVDDIGGDPLRDEAQWLRPYMSIDYDALGRDLSADLMTHETPDGVHVFDPL